MELLIKLLEILNNFSPLAVIALLGVIIFMLVKGGGNVATKDQISKIEGNDLHHLPQVVESLQRIEISLAENFSWIRARMNGGK